MTFSIVAHDPSTGFLGIAVASRFFAVGAVVPYIRAEVAVATQAFINPLWGLEGVRRLARGEAADALLAEFSARDRGHASRQVHMMDAAGRSAAYTGAACIDWAGHLIGDGFSVAGNMLAGPDVLDAVHDAYLNNMALPFADRLLTAMEAGEAGGGDNRGRQSAALRIHRRQDYAWLDLRADDHADPLAELRRLLAVAAERYLLFADAMATAEDFSGTTDRTELDAAIARAEAGRKAAGQISYSQATDTLPDDPSGSGRPTD